ncbi:hypothetical protein IB267_16695 [Ensifer sp. ENS09]|uniref:hypothetical protein n=1 Tax=Ensifer sp. ENS09 TaxID=2769263 RepID=UPI001782DCCB|nr:hypothetical protein [Ensifer sp. ENS09]MBD9649996.1 hypothetical protein [Ensifer sp. ENS09]
MADSDNSRTLPTVTRGDLHSLVAACLPTPQAHSAPENPLFEAGNQDEALAAWHLWRATWDRMSESTAQLQHLETSLFSADPSSSRDQDGSRAYNEALEVEDRAALAEELAAQALWLTPAPSIAGVAAKLDAIVTRNQPSLTCSDEPWPQIRTVLADLLKIDTAADPSPRLSG